MIEQQARVTHSADDLVRVRIGGQSGCAACDEGRGCGAGLFGKLLKRKPLELELPNHIGAIDGQAVSLGLSESLFLKLVFRLYGRPLFAGLLGAMAGLKLAGNAGAGPIAEDLATLAGAVISVALVLIFWNRASKPEVRSRDIQLLEKPIAGNACNG